MADKSFIVATAGHVDHGKSTLVRVLTGTNPDRLPEERARGITIDLGFANLVIPAPAPSKETFKLGIVDVPGHEDFVKNMVAGVGSVDMALLVVAADDGWMPQSEEHLQILTYLGVRRGVVALTKIDRIASPLEAAASVRLALRSSPLEDAPIIPTSVLSGQGVEELKAALARLLADAPLPGDAGKPRLPIDRVFALRGIGTVVTGTLIGGALRRGEAVVVQPSGRTAHIRTLQNHHREVELLLPGTRAALNLPELDVSGTGAVTRGEVVTRPEFGGATSVLDLLLTRSERAVAKRDANRSKSAAARPLVDGVHVRVHHGSGAWTACVHLLDRQPLMPGGRAIARLRFAAPIFAFAGDRLILRDGAEQATLAGGIVLDPEPGRRTLRSVLQRRFLERRAIASEVDAAEAIATLIERDRAIRRSALLRRSPFSDSQIADAVVKMVGHGQMTLAGDFVVDASWWKKCCRHAADIVETQHRAHPEQIGLPLDELRCALTRELTAHELFDAVTADLVARGEFIRAGATIRRASHLPKLPLNLRTAGDRLRVALAAKPFEPPSRRELTPDAVSRQALRFMCDTAEALEIGEELVLLETSYRRMKTIISRTLRATGSATTSELRQVLGTTRRVIVPVLEHLDREGVTRREGDRRALRGEPGGV